MNILKWFKKEKPVYTFPEYEDIDLDKPPLHPPLEERMCYPWGEYETEFSKQRNAAWSEYMRKRKEALEHKKTIKNLTDIILRG